MNGLALCAGIGGLEPHAAPKARGERVTVELRSYQAEAVDAVDAAIERGIQRPLVELATGGGKTIIFAEWLNRRQRRALERGKTFRALVLAHREELLDQASKKIRAVIPSAWVGTIQADRDERMCPIQVASVQTLSQPHRLQRFPGDFFDCIVVDEAHHAPAESYRRILEHFGVFTEGGTPVLGVTATAERSDGVGLNNVWQEIVYRKSMLELMAEGHLCDLTAKRVQINIDWKQLRTTHGDFAQGQAGSMLMESDGPGWIAKAWAEYASERKGLVFVPTVEVAHACAESLKARGIPSEAVDGTTPGDLRASILRRLHTGETRVVPNVGVLTEGFDEPSIDCIVMARPTKSRGLYVQMLGRGTRKWPGKENCLVLDLSGNTERHDLQSVASLFGLGLDALQKSNKTVLQALEEKQKRDSEPMRVNGRLLAFDVDLLKRKAAQWVSNGRDSYLISLGRFGQLVVKQEGEECGIYRESRDKPRKRVASAPTMDMALELAEQLAKKAGPEAKALMDPKARWRTDGPTDRQLETLRKFRVQVPEGLTKGDASAMITREIARMQARRGARRSAGR